MAEFCKTCAEQLGFEPDLTIEQLQIEPGYGMHVICEGCGFICLLNHEGEEVIHRSVMPKE